MTDEERADLKQRYRDLVHAMQSGVAQTMWDRPKQVDPKHLRVGVNVALRDHSSLVKLLISKGVISEDEYLKAVADGMQEEVEAYEREIGARLGTKARLG